MLYLYCYGVTDKKTEIKLFGLTNEITPVVGGFTSGNCPLDRVKGFDAAFLTGLPSISRYCTRILIEISEKLIHRILIRLRLTVYSV